MTRTSVVSQPVRTRIEIGYGSSSKAAPSAK
jgi:hypothetical protein